ATFKAAGVDVKTPFPRMMYDEAIRQYGTDKPDLRLPRLMDVRPAFTDEDLAELRIDGLMEMVAVGIPRIGKISDREKKEIEASGKEITRRFKVCVRACYIAGQLEKKRPEAAGKGRDVDGAGPDDLIVPVVAIRGGDGVAKTYYSASRKAQFVAAGEIRLDLARKY